MLKLEDISIQRFKTGLFTDYRRLFDLLEDDNIENYQQLSDFIDECDNVNSEYLSVLKKELLKVKEKIERLKSLDIDYNINTYNFDRYDNSGIDMFSLEKTDRETFCNRLIFLNPSSIYTPVKMNDFFIFLFIRLKI